MAVFQTRTGHIQLEMGIAIVFKTEYIEILML